MTTPTDLTVTRSKDGHVCLRLHTSQLELQLTRIDATRIADELDHEIHARGHASVITINLDEQHAIEVDVPTAKRLAIELRLAVTATAKQRRRRTDKERAFIDDSIALGRARTSKTAVSVARKMIDDDQSLNDTLTRLWNAAYSCGWDAGTKDITSD